MNRSAIFVFSMALTTGTALAQSGVGGAGSAPADRPASTPIALTPMSQPTSVAPGSPIGASPQAPVAGVTQLLATQPAVLQPVPSMAQRSLTQPSTPSDPPSVSANPPTAALPLTAASRESQARAKIEADGYKNVGELTRGPDGMWRGSAMRGSTRVRVTVDAHGYVSLQ